MLHIFELFLNKFKLKINSKKIKAMIIDKVITKVNIKLNNGRIQQVNKFLAI